MAKTQYQTKDKQQIARQANSKCINIPCLTIILIINSIFIAYFWFQNQNLRNQLSQIKTTIRANSRSQSASPQKEISLIQVASQVNKIKQTIQIMNQKFALIQDELNKNGTQSQEGEKKSKQQPYNQLLDKAKNKAKKIKDDITSKFSQMYQDYKLQEKLQKTKEKMSEGRDYLQEKLKPYQQKLKQFWGSML